MKWSLKLGKVFGIDVYLHFTFLLLLAFLVETVDETAPLEGTVEAMHARQCATIPVLAGGRMVGLLTLENISEMIMVNAAMKASGAAGQ